MKWKEGKTEDKGSLLSAEAAEKRKQDHLRRLRNLRLMDDDFLTKCFEGANDCAELVLRIVIGEQDLMVSDVRTQVFVENLLNRSVRLDVLATDSAGRKFNVEIQRDDRGTGRRRARYNSSMMDANLLEKGSSFDELPETFVIFITENDVMDKGQPLYRVERCFTESGERFGDGSHILYVNGAYRGETPIGRLMHDFACTDPSEMHYEVLAERVRYFKESKEGVFIMCKAMEDMVRESLKEGIKEGMKETALRMLAAGKYALEEIVNISGLSLDEVMELKAERK